MYYVDCFAYGAYFCLVMFLKYNSLLRLFVKKGNSCKVCIVRIVSLHLYAPFVFHASCMLLPSKTA